MSEMLSVERVREHTMIGKVLFLILNLLAIPFRTVRRIWKELG